MKPEFKKLLCLIEEWEYAFLGVISVLIVLLLVSVLVRRPPQESIATQHRQVEFDAGRINAESAYRMLEKAEEAELPSPHALKSGLDVYAQEKEKTRVQARKKENEDKAEDKDTDNGDDGRGGDESVDRNEKKESENAETGEADESADDEAEAGNIFLYKGYRDTADGKLGIFEHKATGEIYTVKVGRQFGNMMVSDLSSTKITFLTKEGREKTFVANEEIEIEGE